jgi:hypothetical protein
MLFSMSAAWRMLMLPPYRAVAAVDGVPGGGGVRLGRGRQGLPAGGERAKCLLWAAAKLADYGIGLGLEAVPEVLLHPSTAERFTRCAPGLSGVACRTLHTNLRFIGRWVVPQFYPADAPLPRERAKGPYGPAEIAGFLALADAQPTGERRMRAAGLVCLGAGAGLIRGDLRDVRGGDVARRSGGVIVAVRGARPRTVSVLARYHARPLAAAGSAGAGLVCDEADPGRRNLTNPLVRALDGAAGLPRVDTSRLRATWLADCADCWGWPRSWRRPGSAARSGSATWWPAWSRAARPTRSRCSAPRAGHDPPGGVRGGRRRLRRRAADRGDAPRRGAAPPADGATAFFAASRASSAIEPVAASVAPAFRHCTILDCRAGSNSSMITNTRTVDTTICFDRTRRIRATPTCPA